MHQFKSEAPQARSEATKKPLSKVHARVLRWVEDFIEANNFSPMLMEIAEGLGIERTHTVYAYLSVLRRKGYLTFTRFEQRSIALVDQDGPVELHEV